MRGRKVLVVRKENNVAFSPPVITSEGKVARDDYVVVSLTLLPVVVKSEAVALSTLQ